MCCFGFTTTDDTCLYTSATTSTQVCDILSEDLARLSNWFEDNLLALNPNKSIFLFFNKFRSQIPTHQVQVNICEVITLASKSAKYLGIIFDHDLLWNQQVSSIISKCSRLIGVLQRYKNNLTERARFQFYKSVIQPCIDYASVTWRGMNATQKDRLHLLEKRAVRVITNSSVRDHTQPLFERLKFVGHETRHRVQLAKAVYKAVNSLLPKSLCDLFRLTADVSHKHTRARDSRCLFISRPRTEALKHTFQYRGAILWNSLSVTQRTLQS